jgi:hypothetical protein
MASVKYSEFQCNAGMHDYLAIIDVMEKHKLSAHRTTPHFVNLLVQIFWMTLSFIVCGHGAGNGARRGRRCIISYRDSFKDAIYIKTSDYLYQ